MKVLVESYSAIDVTHCVVGRSCEQNRIHEKHDGGSDHKLSIYLTYIVFVAGLKHRIIVGGVLDYIYHKSNLIYICLYVYYL